MRGPDAAVTFRSHLRPRRSGRELVATMALPLLNPAVNRHGASRDYEPCASHGLPDWSRLTVAQLKAARRHFARRLHPDIGGSTPLLAEINAAIDAELARR